MFRAAIQEAVNEDRLFKVKVDLREQVFGDVTFLQVRDVIKRKLGLTFSSGHMGIALRLDEINEVHLVKDKFRRKLNRNEVWTIAYKTPSKRDLDRIPYTLAEVGYALALGENVCLALARQGFLEALSGQDLLMRPDYWNVTARGATLLAQSLLKKLSRQAAIEKLLKAIQVAEEFNLEAGPNYYITSLHLFGSLLNPEKNEVGDVDLAVCTEWRFPEILDMCDKLTLEHQRAAQIRPAGYSVHPFFLTQYEAVSRLKRISPYVQPTSGNGMLEGLATKNEPQQAIYVFKPPHIKGTGASRILDEDVEKAASRLAELIKSSRK